MRTTESVTIHGHVSTGFEAVRDAFAENFARRHELGGACCVYRAGEKVVDLWAGSRNSRGLSHEGMRVEVASHGASSPGRIGELAVRVYVPAELSPHMATLLARAAKSCPAHHTLELGAKVTLQIEAAAAAA